MESRAARTGVQDRRGSGERGQRTIERRRHRVPSGRCRAAGQTVVVGPGAFENGALRTATVQSVGHVRPVRGQLRGGVPADRRLRARRAHGRAVRTGHGRARVDGRGRTRGQVPGSPVDRVAGPGRNVRPGAGAARGRRTRRARRPAVLRRRGHAVDRVAGGTRPAEHRPRPVRVLPDRVQRVRPGGRLRPGRLAQPLPGQPGHRLLEAVRLRHSQRVQVRPVGHRRLQHDHPGLGQRGRGPVREVRPVQPGRRVPGRRPGPGARLPSGRVQPHAARTKGDHVQQHALRHVRQRGPVRQHNLQELAESVRVRRPSAVQPIDESRRLATG